MKLAPNGQGRDFELNTHKPRYGGERAHECHCGVKHLNCVVLFLVLQHVEGFRERELFDYVKAEQTEAVIDRHRFTNFLVEGLLRSVHVSLNMRLIRVQSCVPSQPSSKIKAEGPVPLAAGP